MKLLQFLQFSHMQCLYQENLCFQIFQFLNFVIYIQKFFKIQINVLILMSDLKTSCPTLQTLFLALEIFLFPY